MNREKAIETASAWVRAHGDAAQQAQALYPFLVNELVSLVPNDAESGIVQSAGAPAVLAANESNLLLIQSTDEGQGAARVDCERLDLSEALAIRVVEAIRSEPQRAVRERHWSFVPSVGNAVEFDTEELLRTTFATDQGPSSGEFAARYAARAAGWDIPDPDEGATAY